MGVEKMRHLFKHIKKELGFLLGGYKYKKVRIFDLDGCLIDSSHRYQTDYTGQRIDLSHWRKHDTPEYIMQDTLLPLVKWLKADLSNPEIFVIFATARACVEGDANYQYLYKHGLIPDAFIHRQGQHDTRGGAALKLAGIMPILSRREFSNATVHVFEDNISYLTDIVCAINETHETVGHFIPSRQGH